MQVQSKMSEKLINSEIASVKQFIQSAIQQNKDWCKQMFTSKDLITQSYATNDGVRDLIDHMGEEIA